MSVVVLICLPLVLFTAIMVAPAYGIIPFEPVDFSLIGHLPKLGNYTLEVTLTDKLRDGNNDEIHGMLGYGFSPRDTDDDDRDRYFLVNFTVMPNDLPKTIPVNVSFTEAGKFTRILTYKFFKINHYLYNNDISKGGNVFNAFKIVGEYGKAADERGFCKNGDLHRLIRPDFSSLVCVRESTYEKLLERGWNE